jgi:crotonobetainyl-CoA:carnitine CoA-transferase CaiB-like acyl-CoA transferase
MLLLAKSKWFALMHELQAHDIAAWAALDARQLVEDPHLAARGFFPLMAHPDAGTYLFPGLSVHLSAMPATYRRPAPGQGEHHREVFAGLLDMTDAEIGTLAAQGVIGNEPPE